MPRLIKHNPSTPLLNQLSTTPPPPADYQILLPLSRSSVAQYLGVTQQYFCNVICGTKRPSLELHNKIMALIEEIRAEQEGKHTGGLN